MEASNRHKAIFRSPCLTIPCLSSDHGAWNSSPGSSLHAPLQTSVAFNLCSRESRQSNPVVADYSNLSCLSNSAICSTQASDVICALPFRYRDFVSEPAAKASLERCADSEIIDNYVPTTKIRGDDINIELELFAYKSVATDHRESFPNADPTLVLRSSEHLAMSHQARVNEDADTPDESCADDTLDENNVIGVGLSDSSTSNYDLGLWKIIVLLNQTYFASKILVRH
ncbi:unnamed protein product [Protopolystoma xenopodis]|uniref:Uncharacterized protein n=1 Tax=Protopolystoma xenopodis TaxID=117903 RepID=A0A448WGE7_9PLAT|nr:unnamed protein product [Protopolystoma xenopodis]